MLVEVDAAVGGGSTPPCEDHAEGREVVKRLDTAGVAGSPEDRTCS